MEKIRKHLVKRAPLQSANARKKENIDCSKLDIDCFETWELYLFFLSYVSLLQCSELVFSHPWA